jgi:CHAT domain-containing protein
VRALEKRLRSLEDEVVALQERISLADPRAAARSAAPLRVEDVRRDLLAEGEVLLEFSLGDSASYLWMVGEEDLVLRRLPPRETVAAAVRRWRAALTRPDPAGDPELWAASSALCALLFGEDGVPRSAKAVYVVPDGPLQFVPFEALLDHAPDVANGAGVRSPLPYAFAGKQVRYGPSASSLVVLAQHARRPGQGRTAMDLLAVGDPAFTESGAEAAAAVRAGLAPLPFSRKEVETIASHFDPARRTLLLGEAARESALTGPSLARYRILHFATHGLVDERRPERSALALSHPRGPGEDGYLQVSEICRLPLQADLVVLSACETGLGKMVRGEGVLGLPRAFFFAGSSAVVVSLWSVSDRSTAELMSVFYRELVAGRASPAEALARAKEALRTSEAFAHPFYWAPFILIGPA